MIKRRNSHRVLAIVFLLAASVAMAAAPPAKGSMDEVKLVAADPEKDADMGRSVAIEGDLVAVGAGADESDGAVYLFRRLGKSYIQEAKLICPDDQDGAEFGRSVAIKGDMVIVGARFADVSQESGTEADLVEIIPRAGAVYVFKELQGEWRCRQKINPPVPDEGSNFGRAIALQGDRLIVTARKQESDAEDDGTAYAYAFREGRWTYQLEISPSSNPADGAYFGQSIVLRGNLMVIGARNDANDIVDDNGNPVLSGAIYVFRRIRGDWTQIAKMTPTDGETDDQYGFSVAMAGDTIAVGARRANPEGAEDAGAAYVYTVKENAVTLATKLTASDADGGDEFGQAVAMAGDVIAVGARRADIGGNNKQGAIYLFRRTGGEWKEFKKLTASDGMAGDEFGYSLAAFGNRMVTGAHFAPVSGFKKAGAAYVIPLKP